MSPDGYGRERWRRDRIRVSNPSFVQWAILSVVG
jgi:hypothetical protein